MSRWEPLGGGCRVLTTEDHGFTTDTLLLAHFAGPKPGETCADLGTGCGAIPLLWVSRGDPGPVTAIEIREEAAALAARSAEENGFAGRIRVICGDVRDYKALLPHEGLDLLACNPPYYPMENGAAGEAARRQARHEETLTPEDVLSCARYALRYGGRLCLCLPVERLPSVLGLFSAGGLEPKRLRMVQYSRAKAPYLFLLECRKGGRPGLSAEPALLLTEENGACTPEMREVYGDFYKTPEGEEQL